MLWSSSRFKESTVLCTKILFINHAFANTCVSIQNSEGKHLCTGFILSLDDGQGSSWVGTAPSCLIDFDDSDEGNQGWKDWLVVLY